MPANANILVIGGGAIGMSIALHLRWRGCAVRLVERGALGAGVSRMGGGWVTAQGRRHPAQLVFALDGIDDYPRFLDRVGARAGFREGGSIVLLETEEQVAARREFLAEQKTVAAYDGFEFLSPAELRRLEPAIDSPHIIAGTYRARDCQIDPPALMDAMASALRLHGVTVAEGANVEALHAEGKGWRAVTSLGEFTADAVVNAAGPSVPALAALAGSTLPLAPTSGQFMNSPPHRPYVNALVVVAHNHAIANCPARDLRQDSDGRLWIGTVNHHGSWDAAVRRADSDLIRASMARIFPELADVPFERGYAGTRVLAVDGLPTYGKVAPGLFVAAPMSGIAECAVAGRTMADFVVDGRSPALPTAFSPDRFAAARAH